MIENGNLFPLTSRAREHHVIIRWRRPVDLFTGALEIIDGPVSDFHGGPNGLEDSVQRLNEGDPRKPYKTVLLEDQLQWWGVSKYAKLGESTTHTHGVDDGTVMGHTHNHEIYTDTIGNQIIRRIHAAKAKNS